MLSALLLKAQRKVCALGFASTLHSISTCSPLATPNTRFCSDLQIGLSGTAKHCTPLEKLHQFFYSFLDYPYIYLVLTHHFQLHWIGSPFAFNVGCGAVVGSVGSPPNFLQDEALVRHNYPGRSIMLHNLVLYNIKWRKSKTEIIIQSTLFY